MIYLHPEVGMSTAQEIKQAISQLSPAELARFREWFDEFDAEEWDRQFESDAKSGRPDQLAEQALDDWHAGKAKEL
jgi:hypothetical protein